MHGFCSILDIGKVENFHRFRGKLVKMIKDAGSKSDDYSVLLEIKLDKFYCIGVMN